MNRETWSGDERALFDALKELITDKFGDLSADATQKVFAAVLEEVSRPRPSPPDTDNSGWTSRITSEMVNPLSPESDSDPAKGVPDHHRPSVSIRAEDPRVVEGVLHQVMEVGAILVRLDQPPALNELVQLTLDFPKAHLTVEVDGRVVNNSQRGTAIEVSGLNREDRVALKAISDSLDEDELEEARQENEDGDVAGARPRVGRSTMEPGPLPLMKNSEDPRRSFAPLRRGRGRRMVQSAMRRRVDLPDPDMNVASSSVQRTKKEGVSTREFYGPPPVWRRPVGDADRIEELASERVLDILLQLSENGFTGVLIYEEDGEDREQLLFDGGYVVERAVKSRRTEEELGPMLLAADRITKRQLAMAAAHADEFERTVARSLMELDILNPEELRHAIAGRLTFVLREFCEHKTGSVRVYDASALSAGFLPQPPLRVHLAVERVIYDRLVRRLSQNSGEQREAAMEDVLDTYPEVIEHERDRLERAVTRPEQSRLVERVVNGRRRLREVMTESALSSSETFAVIFALHRMGLIRFDRSLHDTVVRERLRENVTVKYLSVHKASYFEVLNVHWSSYSEVIKEAYDNLVQQFDPEKIPDDMEEEVHQRVSEINERVEAAYAALAKRKTRHAYRTRIMPEYKLDHAIPLFLKQCELAERRQQWEEARDAILRVIEIAPDQESAKRKLERFDQILAGEISPDPADTNQ